MEIIHLIIGAGVLAVVYGIVTSISVLSADTGNEKMQEIAGAIQEGASAYLSRQYSTIAIVGLVILVISYFLLGLEVSIGFLIGAVLSGIAGYIGMLVSVRANVRTRSNEMETAIDNAANVDALAALYQYVNTGTEENPVMERPLGEWPVLEV